MPPMNISNSLHSRHGRFLPRAEHPNRREVLALTSYTPEQRTYPFMTEMDWQPLSVTHLLLCDWDMPCLLLSFCTNVTDLTFTFSRPADYGCSYYFVEDLRLQRLSTNIGHLLDNFLLGSFTDPAFSRITHLILFDDVPPSCDELVKLPSLTHLCLSHKTPIPALSDILSNLPHLRMLLTQWQKLEEIQPEDFCKTAEFTIRDVRFVMIETYEGVYEWELVAYGRPDDMWERARRFIAAKIAGEIEGDVFWLYAELVDPGSEEEPDSDSNDGEENNGSDHHDSGASSPAADNTELSVHQFFDWLCHNHPTDVARLTSTMDSDLSDTDTPSAAVDTVDAQSDSDGENRGEFDRLDDVTSSSPAGSLSELDEDEDSYFSDFEGQDVDTSPSSVDNSDIGDSGYPDC
ncbi:hypothetical protein C8R43DRAFT_183530 [Mycena crocata]|nr:hypothetical protein C8R43DRAFT_183530 [Mycena crocata]